LPSTDIAEEARSTASHFVPRVDILLFAEGYLGLHLYGWQQDILLAIQNRYATAAAICNGGGKSSVVIQVAVLWFLYNWPKGRCPIISGSWNQVETQLWPALKSKSHLPYFEGWEFQETRIRTGDGGFARGMSPDDARKAEGYHQDPDLPVFYVLDEAKALSDDIINGVFRCTPTFYLITSSTGLAQGLFYECFNKLTDLHWTIKVTSFECPHISEEMRERDKYKYGGEHSINYRSKHLSEFDEETTGLIISPSSVRRALENGPAPLFGARSAFCDFAAGGDENAVGMAEGNRTFIAKAWREIDTAQACREFVRIFKEYHLSPSAIWGDNSGLGKPMIDTLAEMGWRINRVDNGSGANQPESYSNRGSEIWFEAAHMIDRCEFILPDDPLFFEQATSRRREYDSKIRLRAESKESMKLRGQRSPDRADAIFGVVVCRKLTGHFTAEKVEKSYVPQNPFNRGFIRF
jgi:phage terminase large subunit